MPLPGYLYEYPFYPFYWTFIPVKYRQKENVFRCEGQEGIT